MASRPSPNSLIHCAVCGEDYSATYRRCPFCGAKNAPAPAPSRTPAPSRAPAPSRPAAPPAPPAPAPRDPDDTYVFDGQDVFDDEEYEDDYRPARPKGGKRLAEKPSSNPFAEAQINWPRLITFLCSLIIIVAALVIVFTVIYPQLHGKDPAAANTGDPSPAVTDPVGVNTQPVDPAVTDPVGTATDPVVPPTPDLPPVGELTDIKLNKYDFTLRPGERFQLVATFTPADWSGPVTWTSTDEDLAMVSPEGMVTHADPNVTSVHQVIITATAGGKSVQCVVYIAGPKTGPSNPPASNPPASNPPATQPPSNGGGVTVGRQGTIVNADGGLRVRPDPSTSNPPIATLLNGNTITVVADAGNGWYQISFIGSGGSTMTGYIMGEFISTN